MSAVASSRRPLDKEAVRRDNDLPGFAKLPLRLVRYQAFFNGYDATSQANGDLEADVPQFLVQKTAPRVKRIFKELFELYPAKLVNLLHGLAFNGLALYLNVGGVWCRFYSWCFFIFAASISFFLRFSVPNYGHEDGRFFFFADFVTILNPILFHACNSFLDAVKSLRTVVV